VNTQTIQIRIDIDTKNKAQKVLNGMGFDMSSAVKVFLKQVINTGSIPFEIRTKNGFTRFAEEQMLRETKEAIKKGKSYGSARKAFDDILR
jgi:DNA-damage-inducible protein J